MFSLRDGLSGFEKESNGAFFEGFYAGSVSHTFRGSLRGFSLCSVHFQVSMSFWKNSGTSLLRLGNADKAGFLRKLFSSEGTYIPADGWMASMGEMHHKRVKRNDIPHLSTLLLVNKDHKMVLVACTITGS